MHCHGSGYRGRVGLYEIRELNEEIRSILLAKGSADQITAAAVAAGMHRLRDDGMEKVRQGVTSVPEVLRVLGS